MSTTYVRPYADTKVVRFLDKYIDTKVNKSHREIAQAAGWSQSNMITMIKKGDAKLPLDRVPGLARAIGVDPMFLFRLALEQHMPDDKESARMLEFICTPNEVEILGAIREATNNGDPKISDAQRVAIAELLAS
ncbi:helix-turn-helix domain-containing protein [Pararhizobium qamdonense]|uniref:helix-turn-helix domain-containing protein n=1 Tax=Pararhizobium qamdonense TaxID=3031126 RepID=UPI0023E09E93|nr:helix-turn-helix transcriptional regulator [Pararhizobium qamdonense]